jgi:hypothetical protein
VTTNESGSYVVPLLPPAKYTVTAERDGFATVKFTDVTLNVNDIRSLQIGLKVGQVKGEVQVTPDDASLVNTSPAVATTIDRTFVGNLPLNGRSFQSLILLTPGVIPAITNGIQPGGFSVNGQRTTGNYFTVDGVSANTGISGGDNRSGLVRELGGSLPALSAVGTTSTLVSVDALEEFKIQTSSYSAEYGRQPGGQVQLVTRSGGNQFHGSAFEYVRNDIFDARSFFNQVPAPKPPLRQNDFGGTFSGPVIRNRTFFFFSYEGLRLLLPTSLNDLVPSMRLRASAPAAVQPLLKAFPLPTGPETLDGGSPSGMAPINLSYSSPKRTDAISMRVDDAVDNRLKLFGRYSYAPSQSLNRSFSTLSGNRNSDSSITLGITASLSSRLTNEVAFNYSNHKSNNNSKMDSFGGATPIDLTTLLNGYNGPGVKQVGINLFFGGAFIGMGVGENADTQQHQINVVDNLSFVTGSHRMKFGLDYRRIAAFYGPSAYNQQVIFGDQSEVLSARPSEVDIAAAQEARPIFQNWSSYAQDSWKASRRLTLDFGLRWEVNPAPHDANGIRPIVVTGVNNLATATLAGPGAPFYKTFYTAFAPRFGAAYQLRGKAGRETIVRGGFGIYYDLGSGSAASPFLGFPFQASTSLSDVAYPLTPALAQPPPFASVTFPFSSTLFALNPDLKLPRTFGWNIALEQSLGTSQTISISYVGSAGRRLLASKLLNGQAGGSGPRPNPNFANIQYVTSDATSDYDALQVQYQRRLSKGLQVRASYTWSHAIDEISDEVSSTGFSRGNADFDVRHNFSAALSYQIPKLSRTPVLAHVLNGWSLDSTIYAESGQPFDLSASQFTDGSGNFIKRRPNVILGVPLWLQDPSVPGRRRLNPSAFQLPATGTQGTLGRNVFRGLPIYQVNLDLRRTFTFRERYRLEFKAEAFNVLNHPMFAFYRSFFSPGSKTLGVPQGTLNIGLGGGLNSLYQLGGNRSMQFSVRLAF